MNLSFSSIQIWECKSLSFYFWYLWQRPSCDKLRQIFFDDNRRIIWSGKNQDRIGKDRLLSMDRRGNSNRQKKDQKQGASSTAFLSGKSRITVVGAVNVDICARPFLPLVHEDSNPGFVSMSMGGVGRNIAHNLRLLGQPVSLITAFGGRFSGGKDQAEA